MAWNIRTESLSPRRKMGWGLVLLLMVATLIATQSAALAQASAGMSSISGVVADASGAVVPDAQVTVRNVETNVMRTVASNDAGRYEMVALQPGPYEVRATKTGFATLERKGIILTVGQRAAVDLILQVSGTAETVTVNANAAAVEVEKTDVSTVVNLNDMLNLPLNGRRWDAFVMTTPGATNDGGYGLM